MAGEYDVLVIGGGTTGAPAGIAAARAGAKTLVVELQSELGGEVWYGVLGAGAVVDPTPTDGRRRVKGALLATPPKN